MHIYERALFRRLHLLLSTLLGEEGLQYSVPGMKRESFMTTLSIFRSIKCSKDVVDANKTKVRSVLVSFLHLFSCTSIRLLAVSDDLKLRYVVCRLYMLYVILVFLLQRSYVQMR